MSENATKMTVSIATNCRNYDILSVFKFGIDIVILWFGNKTLKTYRNE